MALDSSRDTLPAVSKQKLGARPLGPLPAGFLRRCQGSPVLRLLFSEVHLLPLAHVYEPCDVIAKEMCRCPEARVYFIHCCHASRIAHVQCHTHRNVGQFSMSAAYDGYVQLHLRRCNQGGASAQRSSHVIQICVLGLADARSV